MLLTLAANSLKSRLTAGKKGRPAADALALTDLPRFARETLGLHGLNLATAMLAGADLRALEGLRDAADKASCPCLVLVENEALEFGTESDPVGDAAIDRMKRVLAAAHRLGCNAVAVGVAGEDTEETFDLAVERLRRVVSGAERMEINVLVSASLTCPMTKEPERLTDLIKKVGGFRIGTFPDFQIASKAKDPLLHLRRLTPYASAITASSVGFRSGAKKGAPPAHEPYELVDYAKTVASVGYTGTLAIDFRGEGDPVEGILQTRAVLESVLGLGMEVEES